VPGTSCPRPGEPEGEAALGSRRGSATHASRENVALLARRFERCCERKRIPPGYRREAVRLELERNLEYALTYKKLFDRKEHELTADFDLKGHPIGDQRHL
jgi:hypothetical protein